MIIWSSIQKKYTYPHPIPCTTLLLLIQTQRVNDPLVNSMLVMCTFSQLACNKLPKNAFLERQHCWSVSRKAEKKLRAVFRSKQIRFTPLYVAMEEQRKEKLKWEDGREEFEDLHVFFFQTQEVEKGDSPHSYQTIILMQWVCQWHRQQFASIVRLGRREEKRPSQYF